MTIHYDTTANAQDVTATTVLACRQRLYEVVRRHDGVTCHKVFASSDMQAVQLLTDWAEQHLASWCDYSWRSVAA